MADKIRKNTFLIKRSNIPGKIPNSGDLQLGELALNTADVILYASGTTENLILPIGWDRINRTGDTMTGTLFAPSISATTISATTLYGDGSYLTGISTLDTYTTGGTYSNGTVLFKYNTNSGYSVTGFSKYFITGSTPVETLNYGDRWFNTTDGVELVYITDTDSSQWVQVNNAFTIGGGSGSPSSTTSITGGTYFSGVTTFKSSIDSGFTVSGYYAPYELKNYSGSTFGEKLQTAINSVPSGVTIDCNDTTGISLTINNTISITKPLTILLGNNLITANVGSGNTVFSISASSVTIKGVSSSAKSSDLAGRTRITMTNGSWHIYSVGNNVLRFEDFDCIGIQSTNYKYLPNTTTTKPSGTRTFNNDGSGGIFVAEGDPYVDGGGNTVSKLFIQNVYIDGTMNSGILLLGGITSRIENCRISNAAGHGMYVGASTTTLSLINNYVSSAVLAGICLDGVATSVLVSNATENAGIGLWLKSCQSVEVVGHYSEVCINRNTPFMPYNTGLFIANSGTGATITDIGSDNIGLFKGSSYVVTGGRNIYLPNPYSNSPGKNVVDGTSNNTRHILVRGNTREIYLLNPRCTNDGIITGGTFDIGIEKNGSEIPRDVNLFFNPTLDGTITPTIAGKYITTDSNERTVVLDEGSNTRIQSGANIWTYDIVSRTVVTGNTYTTLPNDKMIVFTGMSTSKSVTLLTPPSGSNVIYTFKDESGDASLTNKVTLSSSTKTINGSSSYDIITTSNGFGSVYYNGTNWFVINNEKAITSATTVPYPYYTVPSSSIINWDVSGSSSNYQVTLTATTTTLNITNVRNGDYGTIIITQGAGGSKAITFGNVNGSSATHKVVNGGSGVISLSTTDGAIDALSFTYNGSNMYWTYGLNYT